MNSLGFLLSLLVLVAFSIVQLVHGNAELRALMDLKSSLDPEGKILSSWSSDGDPCSGLFQKRPVFSWFTLHRIQSTTWEETNSLNVDARGRYSSDVRVGPGEWFTSSGEAVKSTATISSNS
ncbi:hypothetical protein HN51_001245 [Arachis hypogaea]